MRDKEKNLIHSLREESSRLCQMDALCKEHDENYKGRYMWESIGVDICLYKIQRFFEQNNYMTEV